MTISLTLDQSGSSTTLPSVTNATTVDAVITISGTDYTSFVNNPNQYVNIFDGTTFLGAWSYNDILSDPSINFSFTGTGSSTALTFDVTIPALDGINPVQSIQAALSGATGSYSDVIGSRTDISNRVIYTDNPLAGQISGLHVSDLNHGGTPISTGLSITSGDKADGFTISGTFSGNATSGTLELLSGGGELYTANITVTGNSFTATFPAGDASLVANENLSLKFVFSDAQGDTATFTQALTDAVCFMPGTMVSTPNGEVAVETLKAGDLVLNTEGAAVSVRWLGRQTVSTVFSDPLRVLPIRVAAGAIDENVPSRDLLVSPDHALFIGGVLVHAAALVNGTSVTRETGVPQTFTYYHVETADHSLILAENTPAETFIDNVDRMAFDNWKEHEALGEGEPLVEMSYPRAKSHRQVPTAIRRQLAVRAAAIAVKAASVA